MGRLLTGALALAALAATAAAEAPSLTTITYDGATATLTPEAMESWKTAHEGYTLESPYGYTPSLSSTVAYTVVFSILTIVHLALAIRFKYASAIGTMVVGGVLEIIGWAGRLWSHGNVLRWDPFIMQICCLIIGPVFFSAWDYTLLGFCIKHLGPQYSLIPPTAYVIIFVGADIVSLILQAVGGGGAAVAAEDYGDTSASTRVMLAGILFQLATTTVFVVLAVDFIVRVSFRRPYPEKLRRIMGCGCAGRKSRRSGGAGCCGARRKTPEISESKEGAVGSDAGSAEAQAPRTPREMRRSQLLLAGVAWATLMIYIRGIYRSVELAQGWDGYVITHEVYFVWLDGFIMVLCMAGLAVTHPGLLLPNDGKWK